MFKKAVQVRIHGGRIEKEGRMGTSQAIRKPKQRFDVSLFLSVTVYRPRSRARVRGMNFWDSQTAVEPIVS